MLTEADLNEFRSMLNEINRLAQEDLVALWRGLEGLNVDEQWRILEQTVPDIVAMYRSTAAETASLFYGDTQDIRFSSREAVAAAQVNREQIGESLRYAMFAPGVVAPLQVISGVVQKHVANGARSYGLSGFTDSGHRWYRAARPGACEFCRLLATRALTSLGTPYSSAEAAVVVGKGKRSRRTDAQPNGGDFHTNCLCLPVRSDLFDPPEHYSAWTDEYYAATDLVGTHDLKQILWAMRNPELARALNP